METNKLIALMPDLAVFIIVVDEGSYTAAAKKLGVTPSALSKQVSKLEKALSVKLLERTTRKLVMSESGKRIYEQCTAMMSAAKQAVEISSSEHTIPAGTVTVAAPKAFMSIMLQPLVTPFLNLYPDIQLKIKARDGDIDLLAEEIDIVFRLTEKPIEGQVLKQVGKVNLVLCASPDYIARKGLPQHPLELKHHDCIYLGETNTDHIWEFHQDTERHSIAVTGRYAVNHSQMRLKGVQDGLGIGIFPDFVIKEALAEGSVIDVLPEWTIRGNYQGVIALQYAQTKYMPARVRVFIDYVTQHLPL
ncbi:LysR family transcriptional regulator [Photobacterium damselae]|uniref:LysR family transcriptional regulator n=1 Tax=Photobacterium damselae TaxID=38293 RepID=A0ACD3T2A4_PHODM|nr:LysR family transcriptional regulator [Photobacterium damselae]RDL34827.1 LysR family transcriptional regulator [Photobacterium damselae]TMX54111.1 LysR family transcriptional regulator [Photobacterium damselae]TMX69827.1 LysR family transcriptional regulator [Photobacterium damselae]TMX77181.1 LysR family transcriptional regulator [Photobacterium damselae]